MFQVKALAGRRAVVGVGAVTADRRSRRRPGTGRRRSATEIVAVGALPTLMVIGVESRVVDAVRDRQPRLVGAGGGVGV